MKTLQLIIKERLAVITLDRGKANPINLEMLTELIEAVKALDADDEVGALVITGKENFFSAGVDLMEVYSYNQEQSKEYWTQFLLFQSILAGIKKPVVAAITGHSPAGGCIIALCTDYRVMAKGPYIIGLNEVPVGIVVPESVFQLYAFWLGKAKAYRYLLEGKLLNVADALADGLIDEIAEPADVLEIAELKARAMMKLNPKTWQQTKLNLRRELIGKLTGDNTATLEKMMDHWWSAETRAALEKMIEKLAKPAKSN
jgi:3,2-trans-enoyl-CoA isomerase